VLLVERGRLEILRAEHDLPASAHARFALGGGGILEDAKRLVGQVGSCHAARTSRESSGFRLGR
jgi:hypothetical protein